MYLTNNSLKNEIIFINVFTWKNIPLYVSVVSAAFPADIHSCVSSFVFSTMALLSPRKTAQWLMAQFFKKSSTGNIF